jgi:hypothetical protein
MIYKFGDDVLLELFRRLQLAMFTGTDVIDNLRRITLELNPDATVSLTDDYKTLTLDEVNKYIHQAAELMDEVRPDDNQLDAMTPDAVKNLGDA